MNEKSAISETLTGFFIAFDNHCLVYFFLIGTFLGCIRPNPDGPLVMGMCIWLLGGFLWYSAKAVLITGDTIVRMRTNGEPLFKAGGLTEYDTEKCRQIGEAVARANRRDSQS